VFVHFLNGDVEFFEDSLVGGVEISPPPFVKGGRGDFLCGFLIYKIPPLLRNKCGVAAPFTKGGKHLHELESVSEFGDQLLTFFEFFFIEDHIFSELTSSGSVSDGVGSPLFDELFWVAFGVTGRFGDFLALSS
jgi:hypothetical protein